MDFIFKRWTISICLCMDWRLCIEVKRLKIRYQLGGKNPDWSFSCVFLDSKGCRNMVK